MTWRPAPAGSPGARGPRAAGPTPDLSIVVPTRDTRELTLACLGSLAAGGVPSLEVVVVDDGSTDGTRAAVESAFPDAQVVANVRPLGFSASVNRGLDRVRGRIVLLLNSDTEVAEGALSALLEAFEQDDRLGIAGARLFYPDGSPQWSGGEEPGRLWLFLQATGGVAFLASLLPWVRALWRRPRRGADGTRKVDWVTGAALAVRRSTLEEVGLLDERYELYAQDLDLCLRVGDAGWGVRIVPAFGVMHWHGSSVSQKARTIAGQHLEALWRDLLRWAEKRRGAAWAARTRRAMLWGGLLRVLGRTLAAPAMVPIRGTAWLRGTAACWRAVRWLQSG